MKRLKEMVGLLEQIVPLVVGGQDGGPGSGRKGHTTAENKNIASGLESNRRETASVASKFPIGSKVRINSQGSASHEVIGHSGNIVHTTGGNSFHHTKLVK